MQRRLETEESGILVILALIVTTKLISVCQLESRFEKINASMRKLALVSPLARALHFFWSPLVGAHRWRPLGIGLWASASGAYASGHRPLWRTPLSIGFWGCPAAAAPGVPGVGTQQIRLRTFYLFYPAQISKLLLYNQIKDIPRALGPSCAKILRPYRTSVK